MTELFADPAQCAGCGACANSCPVQCITMEPDREGFLYPRIGAACTGCGVCTSVCGWRYQRRNEAPHTYALRHRDPAVVEASTSGGAFTAICQAFCKGEYAVFGAVQDDGLTVSHRYVTEQTGLSLFRKTKYVQSDTGKTYAEARAFLDAGRRVLYSGTPCQIAGLKAFLRKEYENLLTVEMICHGVGSPLVYRRYMDYLERRYRSRLIHLDFRDKGRRGWEDCEIKAVFQNRRVYRRFSLAYDDPYMIGYLTCLSTRPSCAECRFASIPRVGDFTVGDLWGADAIAPDMDAGRGLSVLLANSPKAKGLMSAIGRFAQIKEISVSAAAEYNLQLKEPPKKNPRRDMFMEAVCTYPFEEVMRRYLRPRPAAFRLAGRLLSRDVRKKIKRYIKKSKGPGPRG